MDTNSNASGARSGDPQAGAVSVLWVLANDRPKADTISLIRWVRAADAGRVRLAVAFLEEPSGRSGPGGEMDATLPQVLADAGVAVHHWPAGRVVQGQALRSARDFIEAEGVRVVHSIFLRADLFASRAVRGTPAAWVSTLGGVGRFRRERLYPAATAMDRMLYGRADHLVAVSRAVADDWAARLSRPPGDFTIIYNSVPHPPAGLERAAVRAELGVGDGQTLALAVSRLDREKGVELLAEAAARLADRCSDLRVAVAGDGRLRGDIERQAADLSLGPRFTLLGERRDVWRLLAAADLFVLPSRMEGCPNAALEAAAAGLPVVAFDVGGTPELLAGGTQAMLVLWSAGVDGLADAIAALVADPEAAARMGRAARDAVAERFSPGRCAADHAALYERLAGKGGGDG